MAADFEVFRKGYVESRLAQLEQGAANKGKARGNHDHKGL